MITNGSDQKAGICWHSAMGKFRRKHTALGALIATLILFTCLHFMALQDQNNRLIGSSAKILKSIGEFYYELRSTNDYCRNFMVLGNNGSTKGDFWKYVCIDEDVKPPRGHCTVYSFGVGEDWSFDRDMVSYFGCEVFMFDPTVRIPQDSLGEKLHFYPIGISDGDKNMGIKLADYEDPIMHGEFKSLFGIKRMLGHERRKIDFLKMDVEGAEFEAFEDAFRHPETFGGVEQISLEIHTNQVLKLEPEQSLKLANQYFKALQGLEDLGFKKVYVNPHKSDIYPYPPQMDLHYIYRPTVPP